MLFVTDSIYSKYLTKDAPKVFGDFKIRGKVIRAVKYADDLLRLVKEEMILQGMIETEQVGKHYRMEMRLISVATKL
jgi:hypothetical protein